MIEHRTERSALVWTQKILTLTHRAPLWHSVVKDTRILLPPRGTLHVRSYFRAGSQITVEIESYMYMLIKYQL